MLHNLKCLSEEGDEWSRLVKVEEEDMGAGGGGGGGEGRRRDASEYMKMEEDKGKNVFSLNLWSCKEKCMGLQGEMYGGARRSCQSYSLGLCVN